MKLTFKVSNNPILELQVTDRVEVIKEHDKRAIKTIMADQEYTLTGLEKRLQYFTDSELPLIELLEQVKKECLNCDFQHNLGLEVK